MECEDLVNTFVCFCSSRHKLNSSVFCSNFTVADISVKDICREEKLYGWAQNVTIAPGATMEDNFCSVYGNLMFRSSRLTGMSILKIGTWTTSTCIPQS